MATVTLSTAQTVSVTNDIGGNGYGWMFQSEGICYMVTPRHVAGELPRITVKSEAPVANGIGTVFRPFWPGLDLALAVVRGGIEERCTETLDSLQVSRLARSSQTAQLLRLSPSGEPQRQRLNLNRRTYLTWEALVAAADGSVYQGTSGAFAFVGSEPIGMAIESENTNSLRLMRSEEIYMNVARFLAEEGGAVVTQSKPPHDTEAEEIRLQLVSTTAPPTEPRFAAENLLTEGVYLFEPLQTSEILFRVDGNKATSLSRFRMTAPKEGPHAQPKDFLVMIDNSAGGTRFRSWIRGQMAPDGQFDSGPMAPRSARWIKIFILNGRAAGPIGIESVSLF